MLFILKDVVFKSDIVFKSELNLVMYKDKPNLPTRNSKLNVNMLHLFWYNCKNHISNMSLWSQLLVFFHTV